MKIPKKLLSSASKLFKRGTSAWSKKKQQSIPFASLEQSRTPPTNRGKANKMRKDIFGNSTSLRINEESGRVPSWRRGETYAPGESSKFNPFK